MSQSRAAGNHEMNAKTGSSNQHPADSHDLIRVQGARENNLKDVNVEIPKRRLTVFTGVSGSGKSSLVFGTIAAAGSMKFAQRGTASTSSTPDSDTPDYLGTADQRALGGATAEPFSARGDRDTDKARVPRNGGRN